MSNINKRLLNLEKISSRHNNKLVGQEEIIRSFKHDVQNINNISKNFSYSKYIGIANNG